MKSKQFFAGIIVGSVLAGTVGVYASGQIISATKTDDTTIFVDGEPIELEDGYEILNYEGRVYTSTRAIVEALGDNVEYLVDNNGKYIYITTNDVQEPVVDPVPPTVVDPQEPQVDPVPPETLEPVEPEVDYRLPPAKDSALGMTVIVMRAENPYDELEVEVQVTNNNNEGSSYFNYGKFKIVDEDGEVYSIKRKASSSDTMFYASIPNKSEDLEEVMNFNNIPAGTKCTLIMPVSRLNVDGTTENADIEIPLIIEEYDTTTN